MRAAKSSMRRAGGATAVVAGLVTPSATAVEGSATPSRALLPATGTFSQPHGQAGTSESPSLVAWRAADVAPDAGAERPCSPPRDDMRSGHGVSATVRKAATSEATRAQRARTRTT